MAYIAVTELSQGQWPEVVGVLVNNVTIQGSAVPHGELLKEASLEAIGYICADIVRLTTNLHTIFYYSSCYFSVLKINNLLLYSSGTGDINDTKQSNSDGHCAWDEKR